jgi:hypothetical protein
VSVHEEHIYGLSTELLDGVDSLGELTLRTKELAKVLHQLEMKGWKVAQPVKDGQAYLSKSVETEGSH